MYFTAGIPTLGKNVVVAGRSKNVGMPIAMLLHTDGRHERPGGEGLDELMHSFGGKVEICVPSLWHTEAHFGRGEMAEEPACSLKVKAGRQRAVSCILVLSHFQDAGFLESRVL